MLKMSASGRNTSTQACTLSQLIDGMNFGLIHSYFTHTAKCQTKWHNPPDLGLVSSVATCVALWHLE